MKNWRKKDIIKNTLRILGFICFMVYVGAFSTGSGGGGGCSGNKNQNAEEPPSPPVLNEKILDYANFAVGYTVFWRNRGFDDWNPLVRPVFTDDGHILCQGLGYFGYDDVESFEAKINYNDPQMNVYWWSDYPCLADEPPEPPDPDTYRPGGRIYAGSHNCQDYYDRDPCYEPDVLPGTWSCTWQWTGSVCAALAYWAIFDADKGVGGFISPYMTANNRC
jgi:hypothetical protein